MAGSCKPICSTGAGRSVSRASSHRRTAGAEGSWPSCLTLHCWQPTNEYRLPNIPRTLPEHPLQKLSCFHLIPNLLTKFPPRNLQPRLLARSGRARVPDQAPSPIFCDVSLLSIIKQIKTNAEVFNTPSSPLLLFYTTTELPEPFLTLKSAFPRPRHRIFSPGPHH